MELKIYLQILLRKWWIILPVFLATFIFGAVFTYRKTPVYSATATFVVAPSPTFEDARTFASVSDILGRRPEIATTYSEIATSRAIRINALDSLSIKDGSDYAIYSKLRGGTNVLEFTVKGPNPTIAQYLANAVAKETAAYVASLSEAFILHPLDEATLPIKPISPKVSLNLALSGIFGLVMGVALAFLSAYLEVPASPRMVFNIIDDETGAYSSEYFLQRLNEEMARAKRNHYPLSIALLRVENLSRLKGKNANKTRSAILQHVAALSAQHLRQEDIVARFTDDTLILLLPDTDGENAKQLMEYLRVRLEQISADMTFSELKFNVNSTIGVSNYVQEGVSRDDLLNSVKRALELAAIDNDGKIYLLTETSSYDHDKAN